jgi:hypothetical protein
MLGLTVFSLALIIAGAISIIYAVVYIVTFTPFVIPTTTHDNQTVFPIYYTFNDALVATGFIGGALLIIAGVATFYVRNRIKQKIEDEESRQEYKRKYGQ